MRSASRDLSPPLEAELAVPDTTFGIPHGIKLTLALLAGTLLGLAVTNLMLGRGIDPAAVTAGPWRVWPKVGTTSIDPYARAILARTSQIPMVSAAGIMLLADRDDDGRPLDRQCGYSLGGAVPQARLWTLSAASPDGAPIGNAADRFSFTSTDLLRHPDGSFTIEIAPSARPGNWLPLSGTGPFTLALRLYESHIGASSAEFNTATIPSIRRLGCAS